MSEQNDSSVMTAENIEKAMRAISADPNFRFLKSFLTEVRDQAYATIASTFDERVINRAIGQQYTIDFILSKFGCPREGPLPAASGNSILGSAKPDGKQKTNAVPNSPGGASVPS